MGAIEKRGNNSYGITVSCGYDNTGKKIFKKKTVTLPDGMTQKQINKELNEQLVMFQREVANGTYLDGSKLTFSEYAEKWLKDYAEVQLRPKTTAHYNDLLDRILPVLGHIKLNKLQPTHLIEFYKNLSETGIRLDYRYKLKENGRELLPDANTLAKTAKLNINTVKGIIGGKATIITTVNKICEAVNVPPDSLFDAVDTNKGLSSKTISHHLKLISAMLTTAVQWQLILSNPAERVKSPKVERKEAKYYSINEVEKMLELLESEPLKYKAIVYVVIYCGLRLGELADLEWSDIDFDNKTLSITKQLQYVPGKGIYEVDGAKTSAGNRTISVSPSVLELLKEYKQWQLEEKDKWGDKWVENDKLFTQDNGEPIFPGTPSSWFRKFIRRNNLPTLTFHQIRHTNASLLISQGVDISTVSNRLGHADKNLSPLKYTRMQSKNMIQQRVKS